MLREQGLLPQEPLLLLVQRPRLDDHLLQLVGGVAVKALAVGLEGRRQTLGQQTSKVYVRHNFRPLQTGNGRDAPLRRYCEQSLCQKQVQTYNNISQSLVVIICSFIHGILNNMEVTLYHMRQK